jgi:CBS domain-containing protein
MSAITMRKTREGEVPRDGATAVQERPDRPVFNGNGPDDYVCVECGNVLAAKMQAVQMTKRVRVRCGRCDTVNVAITDLRQAENLRASDVVHKHMSTLPASVTVGEVRDYFAASASRQLAVLVDGERYVGSIPAPELADDVDPGELASSHATPGPTIAPRASAADARDLALAHPSGRVAVVDDRGSLVGIVAVNETKSQFCGT